MKKLFVLILLILSISLFTACGDIEDSNQDLFIGTWEGELETSEDVIFTFYEDGTYTQEEVYQVPDQFGNISNLFSGEYSVENNNTLLLTTDKINDMNFDDIVNQYQLTEEADVESLQEEFGEIIVTYNFEGDNVVVFKTNSYDLMLSRLED